MDGYVPEICLVERKKFLDDLLRYERAIQDISRVLSEDFHRSDHLPHPQAAQNEKNHLSPLPNRLRSFSCADGGETLKSSSSSPHDRYNGVWGGMDLHSSSLLCPPTKDRDETPIIFPQENKRKSYSLCSTGIVPKHFKSAGYNAEELRLNGFTAPQLIGAGIHCLRRPSSPLGFTLDDLRETEFPLGDGVYAGFTIQELRESGGIALPVLAAQRKIADASATSMASDGFTFLELQEAGYDLYGMLHSHIDEILIDVCDCIRILFEQQRVYFDDSETTMEGAGTHARGERGETNVQWIDSRIIEPIIGILSNAKDHSHECLHSAAITLGEISTSKKFRSLITESCDAIPVLVEILRKDPSDSGDLPTNFQDDCKEAITWVLRNLCIENPKNMTEIALAGAIDPLVDQLLYGNDSYKIAAAHALCNLACDNSNTAAITSAGAITPLVKLLSHSDVRSSARYRLFFLTLL